MADTFRLRKASVSTISLNGNISRASNLDRCAFSYMACGWVAGYLRFRSKAWGIDICTLRWDTEVDVLADGACESPDTGREASGPASWTGDWSAGNIGEEEAVV